MRISIMEIYRMYFGKPENPHRLMVKIDGNEEQLKRIQKILMEAVNDA